MAFVDPSGHSGNPPPAPAPNPANPPYPSVAPGPPPIEYVEVVSYTLTLDDFKKTIQFIDDEVYNLTDNFWNRLFNSVGKAAIGFVPYVGTAYTVVDTFALFFIPSYADELGTTRYRFQQLEYKYYKTEYTYEISLISTINRVSVKVMDGDRVVEELQINYWRRKAITDITGWIEQSNPNIESERYEVKYQDVRKRER